MDVWACTECEYEYDPEFGDPDDDIYPGTLFEAVPEDWVCPLCGADKNQFKKLE